MTCTLEKCAIKASTGKLCHDCRVRRDQVNQKAWRERNKEKVKAKNAQRYKPAKDAHKAEAAPVARQVNQELLLQRMLRGSVVPAESITI